MRISAATWPTSSLEMPFTLMCVLSGTSKVMFSEKWEKLLMLTDASEVAAPPDIAIPLYEQFLRECEALGFPPQHGEFGAYMQVASENDGPVTLIVDTDDLR